MQKNVEVPPIQYKTYINASPAKVYDMITTGEGWDAWFTQGTTVDVQPGGKIMFRWKNFGVNHYTVDAGGLVLEAIPNSKFVFQWTPGDSTTTITFDLEPLGSGTVIQVTESGHTASKKDLEALVECASGWGEALALLKMFMEHGVTYGVVPEK